MTTPQPALLPPRPDVSGWHYVTFRGDGNSTAWFWSIGEWQTNFDCEMTPRIAYDAGWRYLCPIPSAEQLQAMGEIAAAMKLYLSYFEEESPIPNDDKILGTRNASITAGMIRRAVGEEK